MSSLGKWAKMMKLAPLALALVFAPAHANHADKHLIRHVLANKPLAEGIGSFTPAAADPRLAAAFARSGLLNTGFRFTPSGSSIRLGHNVTVAVRARTTNLPQFNIVRVATVPSQVTPTAYNLGVAVGWRKFALIGDYHKTDLGLIEGGREGAGVGLAYNARKWSSRVSLLTEHATSVTPRALGLTDNIALDVGGAYRLTHNFDVTAGVRYKRERDRLEQFSDTKRDSQAVYIGTQFKF